MVFSGYSKDIQRYFGELKANNNQEWFQANRKRFDEQVIAPSQALVEAVAPALARQNPPLNAEPKINGTIRRIYRDTRFSKDKTPYHTYLHLIFWTGAGKPLHSPGVHIVLGAEQFSFGAGQWGFGPNQLARFRADISKDGGAGVREAVNASLYQGAQLDPPDLKRVPRGFDKNAAGADWLRHKGLIVRHRGMDYPQAVFSPLGADLISDICAGFSPLMTHLSEKINE